MTLSLLWSSGLEERWPVVPILPTELKEVVQSVWKTWWALPVALMLVRSIPQQSVRQEVERLVQELARPEKEWVLGLLASWPQAGALAGLATLRARGQDIP